MVDRQKTGAMTCDDPGGRNWQVIIDGDGEDSIEKKRPFSRYILGKNNALFVLWKLATPCDCQ